MGALTDAFDSTEDQQTDNSASSVKGSKSRTPLSAAFDAAEKIGDSPRRIEYIDSSNDPNTSTAPSDELHIDISGTSTSKPSFVDNAASAIGNRLGSSATGSAALGVGKGAFDTLVDGPAQVLANGVANVYPKNWPGYDYFQQQKDIANQGVKDRSANFAATTKDHPTAASAGEIAGGIGGALALPLGSVGEGANLVNKMIYAAKTGAAVGATKPLEDTSNFWADKAKEAAAGAAGGLIGYPVAAVAGKAIGSVADGAANLVRPLVNKVTGAGADVNAAVANSSPELQAAVAEALKRGQKIDPDALSRQVAADALPVKIALTPGQATQNPMLISQEQNMRGANPALGYRFNDQNAQLVQNIAAMKKDFAPDARSTNSYEASQNLIGSLQSQVEGNKANISDLYKKLADANGGSLPLDGQTFAIKANEALGGLTGKAEFLPAPIQSILNRLQQNKGNMDYSNFEALRSILATEARSNTNGNAVAAVNTVRKVLEDMPMTAETEGIKPLADAARAAAKSHFDLMRDVPAYKAVANGTAEPDNFARKFIIGAPTSHLTGMANILGDDPAALQELKAVGLHYLKDSSVNHAGNFSQSGYNDALKQLNPKLPVLYGPKEANLLQTLGDVATHVQARPAGSFVNSSNTETANLARGAGNMAGMAVNAATHSPVGSIVNNAVQNAVEKKAATNKLNDILNTGAGISSPGPVSDYLRNQWPSRVGQAGAVSLSSIASDMAGKKINSRAAAK